MYAVSGLLLAEDEWDKINGTKQFCTGNKSGAGAGQAGAMRGKMTTIFTFFSQITEYFKDDFSKHRISCTRDREPGSSWPCNTLTSVELSSQYTMKMSQKNVTIHPDSSRWQILIDPLFEAKCGSRCSFKLTFFLSMLPWSIQLLFIYLFGAPWQGRAAKLYLDTSSGGIRCVQVLWSMQEERGHQGQGHKNKGLPSQALSTGFFKQQPQDQVTRTKLKGVAT